MSKFKNKGGDYYLRKYKECYDYYIQQHSNEGDASALAIYTVLFAITNQYNKSVDIDISEVTQLNLILFYLDNLLLKEVSGNYEHSVYEQIDSALIDNLVGCIIGDLEIVYT